jgi:phosphoglycerate kinase
MIPLNKMKTVDQIDVTGKTVFLRADFNVPIDAKGDITDDTRIRATIPTIKNIIERDGKLVIASHLGRPKGKPEEKYSLLPCADQLSLILKKKVTFVDNCLGDGVKKLIKEMDDGDVMLLENTRFHSEEEKNDDQFSNQLANGYDIYINDAFGTLHRAHASTVGMVKYFKVKGIGLLVKKELEYLNPLLDRPERPFTLILGGAKVSDKIAILENLVKRADKILVGGGMAYTFLKSEGHEIGKSLFEEAKESRAARIIEDARARKCEFILPKDHVVADKLEAGVKSKVVKKDIPKEMMGLDIGPETIEEFKRAISESKTIFWNGPLGAFETEPFNKGTFEIAKAVASLKGKTIVGGGDSVSALTEVGCEKKVSHVSTGGGATLEFLEGKILPGLEVMIG